MSDKDYDWQYQYEEDEGGSVWIATIIVSIIVLAGGGLVSLLVWRACA